VVRSETSLWRSLLVHAACCLCFCKSNRITDMRADCSMGRVVRPDRPQSPYLAVGTKDRSMPSTDRCVDTHLHPPRHASRRRPHCRRPPMPLPPPYHLENGLRPSARASPKSGNKDGKDRNPRVATRPREDLGGRVWPFQHGTGRTLTQGCASLALGFDVWPRWGRDARLRHPPQP